MAFVVRSLVVGGMPEAFSQQIDAPADVDHSLESLLARGWRVIATEAMPGGMEATCLIIVESPPREPETSEIASRSAVPQSRKPTLEDLASQLELHNPAFISWDGESFDLRSLNIES